MSETDELKLIDRRSVIHVARHIGHGPLDEAAEGPLIPVDRLPDYLREILDVPASCSEIEGIGKLVDTLVRYCSYQLLTDGEGREWLCSPDLDPVAEIQEAEQLAAFLESHVGEQIEVRSDGQGGFELVSPAGGGDGSD